MAPAWVVPSIERGLLSTLLSAAGLLGALPAVTPPRRTFASNPRRPSSPDTAPEFLRRRFRALEPVLITMPYALSLLDKSPVPEGATAAEALGHTIALAKRAEALGYRRFWVAEHHGTERHASSAPEILVAHLLAHTSRIRIGSGGVMLQHYSPYKVAETFNVLAALAPGRVDLGIGKAPGGLPLSTKALQVLHDRSEPPSFAARLADLDAFLTGLTAPDHPLAGAVATPIPAEPPQRILLGTGPETATLAAQHGWDFAYAGHFDGDPGHLARSVEAYRQLTGRAPLLAIHAFAAETLEEALARVERLRIYKVHLPNGQSANVGTHEMAAEFARQAGADDYRVEERVPYVATGTAEHVKRELDGLAARHGIREFVIDLPVADPISRLSSIELLASVYQSSLAA